MHPYLDEAAQDRIIAAVASFGRSSARAHPPAKALGAA